MSATARIMAYLGMNPADFNKGVDQAHSKVKGFEGALSGMKGKLVAAFSIGAIAAGVKNIANASGAIVDYAENLRVSTDEFQALTLASKEYGLTQDDVVNALQKVMRAQEDAASANPAKTIAAAFDTLRISIDELDSSNPAELFEKIAKGAQGGSEQMAAAFDIIGRSGPRFRSFMEGISQFGLAGAIQDAKESGRLIGEAALLATDEAIDQKIIPFVDKIKAYAARAVGAVARIVPGGVSRGFVAGDQSLDMSAANASARQRALDEKADAIMVETAEKRADYEFEALSNSEKRLRIEQAIAWNNQRMTQDIDKYERAILERDTLDFEKKLAGIEDKIAPSQMQTDQFRRIGANVFGGTTIDNTAKKSLTVQEKMLVEMKAVRAAAEKAKQGVF
jgi:hypothetical protein